jgi:subtilisin-like proprotein convertase family protein
MPATIYNFNIEQSSDFYISFQYLDENGNNVDLTNACVQLRYLTNLGAQGTFTNGGSGTNKPTLFNSYGYTLTSNRSGLIELTISTARTSTYAFDSAVYDLDIQFDQISSGSKRTKNIRIATGTITIGKKNFIDIGSCDPNSIGGTPTPSGPTPTPTPTPTNSSDLCFPECVGGGLDIFSVVYPSPNTHIVIPDCTAQNTSPGHAISTISGIYDPRPIENIEVAIVGLNHANPQDLIIELTNPLGNYSLSQSNKISNYSAGFNFIFSNKAASGVYVNTVSNGGYCNSFEDLMTNVTPGYVAPTGDWTLNIYDNDVGVSGYIDSWKLIVTYVSE